MPTDSESGCDVVSKEWLLAKLRSDERDTILIDCRGSNEYSVSHIRSAVNFSIPSIMLRRLAAGKIELASTVQCKELKARITHCCAQGTFVLYSDGAPRDPDSVHGILLKRLKQDGVQVVCLEAKIWTFNELVESFNAMKDKDCREQEVTTWSEAMAPLYISPTLYSRIRDLTINPTEKNTPKKSTVFSDSRDVQLAKKSDNI